MMNKKHVFWNHPLLHFFWIISIHRIYNKCEHKTLKMSSVFYFSVVQPPRCIAGNPLASTRPHKFYNLSIYLSDEVRNQQHFVAFVLSSRELSLYGLCKIRPLDNMTNAQKKMALPPPLSLEAYSLLYLLYFSVEREWVREWGRRDGGREHSHYYKCCLFSLLFYKREV